MDEFELCGVMRREARSSLQVCDCLRPALQPDVGLAAPIERLEVGSSCAQATVVLFTSKALRLAVSARRLP